MDPGRNPAPTRPGARPGRAGGPCASGSLALCAGLALVCAGLAPGAAGSAAPLRPNILWITCEDTGPHLGCYGDTYATTPNLDRLAARGMIYRSVWSTAPVCAPARTTIISGLYPSATGSEHMRSQARLPEGMRLYPQHLRAAGYYCSNNSKEDYNLEKPGLVWDESSPRAHWRNRGPGQPFFAIFNHTQSHESQIRVRPHVPQHDPSKVRVPAYHPDAPEVRQDWAQYFDKVTEVDAQAGRNLAELAEAGLADDTVVFFYGDHGSGMPRSKRWCYNSGLQVPLVVYFPPKFRHLAPREYAPGVASTRPVGFVDLAPTVLSLAGIEPPKTMQGRAFLGPFATSPSRYLYGLRGRMDERYDLVRSVRDERYVYIRNYMPHRIYGQHVAYMFETPTTQVWKSRFDAGALAPPQAAFWQTKPPEELYDLATDPDEVRNLAGSPGHRRILARLRAANRRHLLEIRDVDFLPEAELHERAAGSTPFELGHDDRRYPLKRILAVADLASSLRPEALSPLRAALKDRDSAVRYWGALGVLMRGPAAVAQSRAELVTALEDSAGSVRVVAAEALARHGPASDLDRALDVLLEAADVRRSRFHLAVAALNALDELDWKAAPRLAQIQALPRKPLTPVPRQDDYLQRLLEKTLRDLGREGGR